MFLPVSFQQLIGWFSLQLVKLSAMVNSNKKQNVVYARMCPGRTVL